MCPKSRIVRHFDFSYHTHFGGRAGRHVQGSLDYYQQDGPSFALAARPHQFCEASSHLPIPIFLGAAVGFFSSSTLTALILVPVFSNSFLLTYGLAIMGRTCHYFGSTQSIFVLSYLFAHTERLLDHTFYSRVQQCNAYIYLYIIYLYDHLIHHAR